MLCDARPRLRVRSGDRSSQGACSPELACRVNLTRSNRAARSDASVPEFRGLFSETRIAVANCECRDARCRPGPAIRGPVSQSPKRTLTRFLEDPRKAVKSGAPLSPSEASTPTRSPGSAARCAMDPWMDRFSRYSKPESRTRTAAVSLPTPSLVWWLLC